MASDPAPHQPFQTEPFTPHPRLRNGHRQTLASRFWVRKITLPHSISEERRFEVEPGIEVLCRCHWQPDRTAVRTLVLVHGLEGSVESQYMIGTSNKALIAGMNVVRMNMRNCGGSERLGPTLYHSGLSADVGAVVRALIREEHLPAITLAGFSMGGNLVLKLAGELGAASASPPSSAHADATASAAPAPPQLKAVIGVSPAMDLGPSADALHHWGNRIYEYNFLLGLRRSYLKKRALHPERYGPHGLGTYRSIRAFDHNITARYSGFSSADDYYYRASSARVLQHIKLPTLVLHALDDPFIRVTPETRATILANPHITYVEVPHGGHCAFIAAPPFSSPKDGLPGIPNDGRWAENQIVRFALAH